MYKKLTLLAGLSVVAVSAHAQVATFTGNSYTQNFDSLASGPSEGSTNTWTNGTTLAGWYAYRYAGTGSGNPQNATQYLSSAGGTSTGALYSAGTIGSSDRSLGVIASGTNILEIGVQIQNNTGSAISSLAVSVDGEQWRSSTSTQNVLTFAYSTTASSIEDDANFTNLSALNIVGQAPVASNGAIAGGAALGTYTATINLATPLAAGSSVWLRWQDVNDVGNDALLSVDNLHVNAQPVPEPASMLVLGLGVVGVARRRRGRK